jgi:hypothetical protein
MEIKITNGMSKLLTKSQKTIQAKIDKIDKLTNQLAATEEKIKKIQLIYNVHIFKEQAALNKQKEVHIVKLYERFLQKSFSVNQKDILFHLISEHLNDLNQSGYSSEIINDIMKHVNQLALEECKQLEDVDELKRAAAQTMRDMGMDINDDFSIDDIYDEEFIKKQQQHIFEQEKRAKQEAEEQQKLEKTAQTDKGFYKLYKTLVKKAHPDLVKATEEKEIREDWMKQLSQAWSDRNYLELLVLEQQITKGSTVAQLTDEQIKPLIKSLNQSISDLEAKRFIMTSQNPNTSYYYRNFNARSDKGILKKINAHKTKLIFEISKIKQESENLNTQKQTKAYLAIKERELQEVEDFWDTIWDDVPDEDYF